MHVRLPRHAGDVPVARARERRAARGGAAPRCRRSRATSQWANFVRNHDELTLDKLTDDEREEVFAALRPRRGHAALRPRPAPPPAADARRRPAAAAHGLQPAVRLPGTPVLFYGDEIGMGENLGLDGAPGGAHADAVDGRAERRLLDRAAAEPRAAAASTARFGPSASTSPTSGATRTRCSAGSSALIRRAARVARARAGARGTLVDSRATERCSPTAATGRAARWSPSTTSAPSRGRADARRSAPGPCDAVDDLLAERDVAAAHATGRVAPRARRLRPPLAARAPRGPAPALLVEREDDAPRRRRARASRRAPVPARRGRSRAAPRGTPAAGEVCSWRPKFSRHGLGLAAVGQTSRAARRAASARPAAGRPSAGAAEQRAVEGERRARVARLGGDVDALGVGRQTAATAARW